MRTPGQPGYGLPPREGIVDLTRDVADLKAQVAALQAVQANSLQINSVYQSVDTLTYPNDSAWHDYCLTATYEPPPWAGRLTFFLNVSAGTTFTGPGAGGGRRIQHRLRQREHQRRPVLVPRLTPNFPNFKETA
jgi:hypothetical protein